MGFVKKIIAITGTRADYGIYSSVFEKLNRNFDFSVIVTGMHLSKDRGSTIKEIKKDKYRICKVIDIGQKKNSRFAMANSVGLAVQGFAKTLEKEKPDLLMVLGDRGEMLAGGIAAIHLNIPVVHLHGGELSGSVDDNLRHALTKLSHIHFVSTEEYRKRVIQLGEKPKYVYNTGAPSLDNILNGSYLLKDNMLDKFKAKIKNYAVLLFHPTTTDTDSPVKQIKKILDALLKFDIPVIAVKSNTDAGGNDINKVLLKFATKNKNIRVYPNIPYKEYLNLLKNSSFLIGNSSSGIIEAASFKVPVINIGNRQRGRVRAENVIDVKFSAESIVKAIKKVLSDKDFINLVNKVKNPYGDGFASDKILKVLKKLNFKKELINKNFINVNYKTDGK